jgi:capsular polysaccharide biosynthesis protein
MMFNLAVSMIVGLLLGVGAVLTIEYFDTSIKSPDDVERVLGLPLLGVVPMFGRPHIINLKRGRATP